VTTVLLVRHGLTAATGHTLSGWTPGIPLDERGTAQARALGARLAALPLDAIISSPLDRCQQTAAAIAAAEGRPPGSASGWLAGWLAPSAVRFPGPDGEAMLDMQHRAVSAVRDWNTRLGDKATYLVCSHGDVIKALIADALGLHLDLSQRIQADPCSLTVIRYTSLRPFLLRMNDLGGGVEDLLPRPDEPEEAAESSDAMVGGGAGAVRDHSADARG
jgi:broad specificity phosphatase PhoE